MPDLAQVEQTCLPTSTANLIIWFGHHGFPKLILGGTTEDDRELHTVHRIMTDTDARFDLGTKMDGVEHGVSKYIRDAGYDCSVEYRGLGGTGAAFSQDWLQENDSANKGFVLFLAYCRLDPETRLISPAWNAGHAVTLVNAQPDMLLVHDPAHDEDETGRKILTPHVLQAGWQDKSGTYDFSGMLLLSGSLLGSPEASQVVCVGAMCVTMQPDHEAKISELDSPTPNGLMLAGPTGAHEAPTRVGAKQDASWWHWLTGFLFYN